MTALSVVNLLVLLHVVAEGGEGGGDPTGGALELLDGAPLWARVIYVLFLLSFGIAGLIKGIGTLRGKGGDDRVEEFLDKAEKELIELRTANNRLELDLERSRDREAELRGTVQTLRELLAERRGTPP